jgi:hypothetical protein
MSASRFNEPILPTTLRNMRANGVYSLSVSCRLCHPWPNDVSVPTFGPRMVCTRFGIIGADERPNWKEQALPPSLTGTKCR